MESNLKMDYQEAIEILHPDTTRQKLAEIEYYGGFAGQIKMLEAVNEACIVACEAMMELQLYKENKLCLIPCEVYAKQCEELDAYKQLGSLDEVRAAVGKQIPKKPIYEADGYADGVLVYDYAECPICGHDFEHGINDWGSNYCSECGQKLDWSVDE